MSIHRLYRRAVGAFMAVAFLGNQYVLPTAPAEAQERIAVATRIGNGLNTTIFETPYGKLKVNLPDDAADGDTLSGTVVAEPKGSTPEEKAENEDVLDGYVVAMTPKKPPSPRMPPCPPIPPCSPGMPIAISQCPPAIQIICVPPPSICPPALACPSPPSASCPPAMNSGASTPPACPPGGTMSKNSGTGPPPGGSHSKNSGTGAPPPDPVGQTIIKYGSRVKLPDGREITEEGMQVLPSKAIDAMPTPPKAPAPGTCTMPTIGQTGKPIEINTPCDGKFGNSKCEVGDKPCKMLAESPRKMVCESPKDVVGPCKIKCQEGNNCAEAPFCNVKIKLSCPKTVLQQGETSTLTCTVSGMSTVDKAFLTIDNHSPDVVSMSGGNHQTMQIAGGGQSNPYMPAKPQSMGGH